MKDPFTDVGAMRDVFNHVYSRSNMLPTCEICGKQDYTIDTSTFKNVAQKFTSAEHICQSCFTALGLAILFEM